MKAIFSYCPENDKQEYNKQTCKNVEQMQH